MTDNTTDIVQIANDLISEPDIDKSKDLIDIFNWALSKKQISRVARLDKLYDEITDQIALRFENKPDQFSNDDLINYLKAIQNAMDATNKAIDQEITPPKIVQNNTQINVNVNEIFNQESRARILKAVQDTINSAKLDYEDKTLMEVATNE